MKVIDTTWDNEDGFPDEFYVEAVEVGIGAGLTAFIVISLAVYLTLNIVGTYYCFHELKKLPKAVYQNQPSLWGGNVAAVFIGWFLNPFVNLCSPITYATHHVNTKYGQLGDQWTTSLAGLSDGPSWSPNA